MIDGRKKTQDIKMRMKILEHNKTLTNYKLATVNQRIQQVIIVTVFIFMILSLLKYL